MRKIAWVLKITGWVLTIRTLWLLIAGSAVGGGIVTGVIWFFSHLPIWLLVIIFIGLAIMLFVGFGYFLDAIKRRPQSKVMPSGLVIMMVDKVNITNNYIFEVKPEDIHGGGLANDVEIK